MLTFLTTTPLAWLAMGAAGALIPLIIHLSRSKRTKKMRFSTTRFFTDQFLRSYRMSKIRELLLLVCRMALAALLALAMARPLFTPKDKPLVSGGPRAVVLVIDNSASMGYTEDNVTLFDTAREAAGKLLDGLKPGDTASVVLAGRRDAGPEAVFPQLIDNRDDVKAALRELKVATLGTDLSGAVARAEAIARSSSASGKEVYVLSDLQDSGWGEASGDAAGGSDVAITFVRIQPKAREHAAVTAVQYGAPRPTVRVPFEIKPYIAMQGGMAGTDVRLVVDGKEVARRHVERPARGIWATPRLHHTFREGGWHSGYVEVSDDALPQDNRRYFAFEVVDSVSVLAVNGAPSSVPRLDELAYLDAALTATPDEDGKSSIQLTQVSPAQLAGLSLADLQKHALVILANVESLAEAAVERLEDYVEGGGRLLVTLGDKVRATAYNESLALPSRRRGGLLPARLKAVAGDPAGPESFATVAEVDYEHPALSAFADPRAGSLASVRFRALWEVEPEDASILMRASSGAALLVEKEFGRGRVMLFTSTIDRDWTNFPVRPTFLPWAHRLVGYLAQESAGREASFATGEEVPVPFAAQPGVRVTVKKPDGREGYPAASWQDPERLAFADTADAGVYQFVRSDQPERPTYVAVNLPRDESNLVGLDETLEQRFPDLESVEGREERIRAGLQKLLPNHPKDLIQYLDGPEKLADVAAGRRASWRFWEVLLIVVLVIALFEPFLANRITLKHYGKAKPIADDALGRTTQGAGRLTARPAEPTEVAAS